MYLSGKTIPYIVYIVWFYRATDDDLEKNSLEQVIYLSKIVCNTIILQIYI